MRRYGNVCDSLVFCLVCFLLPMWLLGHLFLAFFPAPDPSTNAALALTTTKTPARSDVSLTAAAKPSERSKGSIRVDSTSALEPSDSKNGSQSKAHNELASLQTAITSLKSENRTLAVKVDQLESRNSDQATEIGKLEDQLSQVSTAKPNQGLEAISQKLRLAKNDYSKLNENYEAVVDSKRALESKIERLESRNQQLAKRKGTVADKEDWQREMETKGQRLEQQLKESNSRLAEQLQLVQTMQAAQTDRAQITQTKVAEQKKLLSEMSLQNKSLQDQVAELTKSLQSANSTVADRAKEVADSRKQLQQLKTKYTLSLKRLASAEADGSGKAQSTKRQTETTTKPEIREPELSGPSDVIQPVPEQYREYVSSRGNRSKLAFIQWVDDDEVIVRSFVNKQLYQLPLSRFSQPDQQYLLGLKKLNDK